MVSLADLRARNVTPIWQEAVAVVQELIQTVKATTGSAELLPDLEHVALIPNGDVVALPGSPAPAVPVRHAAVMLQLLIDGVAVPPELEQFVGRNVAQPPQYDSVAEFSRNLAFFERPGRRSDVERLVARALAAEQTSRADEELERLKTRAAEVTQVMESPDFLQQPQKARTVPIALVAAVGVVTIALGLWLWQQARAPEVPAAPAAGAAPPDVPAAAATPAGDPAPAAAAASPAAAAPANAAPAPAPQSDRSLLDRASDAVRTAVNTLVGSSPPSGPAMANGVKPRGRRGRRHLARVHARAVRRPGRRPLRSPSSLRPRPRCRLPRLRPSWCRRSRRPSLRPRPRYRDSRSRSRSTRPQTRQ